MSPGGLSDHTPREQAVHDRQIQPAFVGSDVGDVGHPDLFRTIDLKLSAPVVGLNHSRLAPIPSQTALVADLDEDACKVGQPGDPVLGNLFSASLVGGSHFFERKFVAVRYDIRSVASIIAAFGTATSAAKPFLIRTKMLSLSTRMLTVKRLRRAGPCRRIAPPRAIAINYCNAAQHAMVINSRLAMAPRKEGTLKIVLVIAQFVESARAASDFPF